MKQMHEIHEEVFNFLMKKHKEDENFLFRFRKINRGNKLDKGYWFLGDDNYLALTFWYSSDKISRTPRIFFKIGINGDTSIQFRSTDIHCKHDFFSQLFFDKLNIHGKSGVYSKEYKKTSYIDSLKNFLSGDKLIIDEIIRTDEFNGGITSEHVQENLDFLCLGDFNKQLEVIKTYREKKKEKINNSGFLHKIEVKKFGPIKNAKIENIPQECRWIFLTGENGAGKTTLLKAIATGICNNIDEDEIIAKKEDFGEFIINIQFNIWNGTSNNMSVNYSDNLLNKEQFVRGFAAYGPIRLLSESEVKKYIIKGKGEKIFKKSTYGLFNPITFLKDFDSGYVLNIKPNYYLIEQDILIENLELIIPNIYKIELNNDNKLVYYEKGGENNIAKDGKRYNELPSGTRSFIGLIMDLLIRFQNQQPKVDDIANYNGIVLIDEIDIHLHPKMQIEIIRQLSDTFPKVQFIVSTHSPIPILGAPENSVFVKVEMSNDRDVILTRMRKLEKEIKYLLPNTILTSDFFDFDLWKGKTEKEFMNTYLEDDYKDIEKNKALDERLRNLDKDIFPDNLFDKEDL